MATYVRCFRCGSRVSNDVGKEVTVRAYVSCPECVEKQPEENLMYAALNFAHKHHAGQVRKYGGAPFVTHPIRVCSRVMMLPDHTITMCIAALLHDTVEDCEDVDLDVISSTFGARVCDLVRWLTNPSKQRGDLPRAERKELDRDHAAEAPREAKLIKLIDRIDNLREMDDAPDAFLAKYLGESKLLAEAIGDAGHGLQKELLDLIVETDDALFLKCGHDAWAKRDDEP